MPKRLVALVTLGVVGALIAFVLTMGGSGVAAPSGKKHDHAL